MWWSSPDPAAEVAAFDSATGMLRALSRYLHGRDVPMLGQLPPAVEPLATALLRAGNRLPRRVAEKAYAASGWTEAIPARHTGRVVSDDLAEWIVGHYPRRRYPVVFIGSSNGALVHLAAALGVPWLPQTVLIPVRRRGGHADDPREGLRLSQAAGEALVEANPDLVLHHMHDANQDRLMIAGMTYFRVKWRRLPAAYRAFLRECLEPGGRTVFNTEPARQALLAYLDAAEPYDEIRLMLFSHGVESAGLASIDQWRQVLARARKLGVFTGVDTRAYPRDFACLARAHRELARVRKTYPMPAPLSFAETADFLAHRPDIDWLPAPGPLR